MSKTIKTSKLAPNTHKLTSRRIPTDHISPWEHNPPSRITESALKGLKADIAIRGLLSPLHVIPTDGPWIAVDGCRRHEIALELGIKQVMCVVHEAPLSQALELWQALNTVTRKISALEWMHVYVSNEGAGMYPAAVKGQLMVCERLFGGRVGLKSLLDTNTSPAVGRLVERTCVQLERLKERRTRSAGGGHLLRIPTPTEVLHWIQSFQTQGLLHALTGSGRMIPMKVLEMVRSRIENERPMTMDDAWRVSVKKDQSFENGRQSHVV